MKAMHPMGLGGKLTVVVTQADRQNSCSLQI